MSLPKAVIDQLLREMDRHQRHRHDSREGCRAINTDMQIVSRADALPPLKVNSRAMVRNLNVQLHGGKTAQQIVDEASAAGAGHNILSAIHLDSLVEAIAVGDLLYVNATSKWARLPKGSDSQYLKLVSGFPTWSDLPAAAMHNLLSTTHPDTLADSVVAGDLLIGNATPKWARLAKGTDGKVLRMTSGLPTWATLPEKLGVIVLPPSSYFKEAGTGSIASDASGNVYFTLNDETYSTWTIAFEYPNDVDGISDVTLEFIWSNPNASINSWVGMFDMSALTPPTALVYYPSGNTQRVTQTIAYGGVANELRRNSYSFIFPSHKAQPGDYGIARLVRDGANASDNLAGAVKIHGVAVKYTRIL